MEKLNSEDGHLFIKNLASFVRTHEKALANALQLQRQPVKHAHPHAHASHSATSPPPSSGSFSSTSSTLAAALSFGALKFTSQNIKPAKLTLTPHHLFYLLSRFEELSIPVGPMNIRLENIHTETMPSYVSFLNKPQRSKGGDRDSIHSVSSVRSVMSGMSVLWSSIGLGSAHSTSRSEKARAALEADLKYLYSAFTKIPCLRLAPDHRARLISGYEEFPFDTAVPLHSFKNLSALEIIDVDFRSFYGWDRLSEQLRTLTIKRAHIDDPAELLTGIVLDDIDKRRRRSSKSQVSPVLGWSGTNANSSQPVHRPPLASSLSAPGSPIADPGFGSSASPQATSMVRGKSDGPKLRARAESNSPTRPTTAKNPSAGHPTRPHRSGTSSRIRRTGSGSSNSSDHSSSHRTGSSSTNLVAGLLPPSKWRFLRHLGLPDNALTAVPASSLLPVANTLHSLDLSSNLLTEVPDSVASLVALRALNLSHCMISSLHSLSRNPLPAITALNLRGNRLHALAGVERLLSLERLDLRDNHLSDPTEIARLTGLPEIREIWVKGNPFVKTHPSYRVVIFNLFRRTPGYFEDIIIDGSGPGYSERKQLVDRVAEPEGAPVIRPVEATAIGIAASSARAGQDHLALQTPADGTQVGTSGRRKKVLRRKIVDLSSESPRSSAELSRPRAAIPSSVCAAVPPPPPPPPPRTLPVDDPFVSSSTTTTNLPAGSRTDGSSLVDPAPAPRPEPPASRPAPVSGTMKTPTHRDDGPDATSPTVALVVDRDRPDRKSEWHATGKDELCRQQIEALQQQFGTGWLALLGDGAWEQVPPADVAHRHHSRHPVGAHCTPSGFAGHPLPVQPSVPILSGRTLG